MTLRKACQTALRALALAAFAAGCSSAIGSPTPTYTTATTAPLQTAPVVFSITPGTGTAGSARTRKPAYLSTATLSVSILPVVTGAPNQKPLVIDIGAGISGCTGSGATLSCSGTISAPVGQTSFTVTAYGATNAQGAVLSVGTISVDVKASSTTTTISNATSLTLSGVPASFSLGVTPQTITIGTASTLTAVVTAYDASGAAIVGPGQLTTGIDLETITPYQAQTDSVLTSSGSSAFVPGCTYPLTPQVTTCNLVTVATSPSQAIPLAYAGEYVPGTAILLVGESPGLGTQAVTIAFASPPPAGACTGSPIVVCPGGITFANPSATSVPLTVTEPGVTTFTASDYGCVGSDIASINFQKMTSGNAFTVYPGKSPGTCSATFTDAAGNSTNINIALLVGAAPSPTPTAGPTSAPTPVPTGPIAIAPSNTLEFASSTGAPQTIVASEAGFTSFTIDHSQCSGIATATPTTGTSFTIIPVASLVQGGSCTLFVGDSAGGRSPVEVFVDGVSFTIDSKR